MARFDVGPWVVETAGGKTYIASDDFTHDVCLSVGGDFRNDAEKLEYMEKLCEKLNELEF